MGLMQVIFLKEKIERLGLKFYSPFILSTKESTCCFSIMIPFLGCNGAKNGLIIGIIDMKSYTSHENDWSIAVENGYYPFNLYYDNAVNMSDEDFKRILNQFFWYGKSTDRPLWYTGEFYQELFPEISD
ncbi:MAG: hypothetical protein WAQ53_08330 [Thiofilum sp.]|uniref:hypothetical protein n=1 Tax=Thiofilum sp. TaxID=2212733 RepID=UPI0025FB5A7E|nr:hypothetical protein [Thiofilum sp.]MBK8453794.1 hypothetical protein [Thiofilum sp.]